MTAATTNTGSSFYYRERADSPWEEVDEELFRAISENLEADLPQMHIPSVAQIWEGAGLIEISRDDAAANTESR